MQLSLTLVTSKTCNKCGAEKPLTAYHRDPKSKDRRSGCCAVCATARAKAWQLANPERSAANKRAAAEAKSDHYRTSRKRRYHANADAAKAATRAWVVANPDNVRANRRRWEYRNPEYAKVHKAARRAREAAAPGTLSVRDLRAVFAAYGNRCAYCFRDDVDLTVDHVVALVSGGANSADNVVPACLSCNSRKSGRGVLYMVGRCESARR